MITCIILQKETISIILSVPDPPFHAINIDNVVMSNCDLQTPSERSTSLSFRHERLSVIKPCTHSHNTCAAPIFIDIPIYQHVNFSKRAPAPLVLVSEPIPYTTQLGGRSHWRLWLWQVRSPSFWRSLRHFLPLSMRKSSLLLRVHNANDEDG